MSKDSNGEELTVLLRCLEFCGTAGVDLDWTFCGREVTLKEGRGARVLMGMGAGASDALSMGETGVSSMEDFLSNGAALPVSMLTVCSLRERRCRRTGASHGAIELGGLVLLLEELPCIDSAC